MEFDVRLISFYTTETQRFRSNSNISEAMDFAVLRNKHYTSIISVHVLVAVLVNTPADPVVAVAA